MFSGGDSPAGSSPRTISENVPVKQAKTFVDNGQLRRLENSIAFLKAQLEVETKAKSDIEVAYHSLEESQTKTYDDFQSRIRAMEALHSDRIGSMQAQHAIAVEALINEVKRLEKKCDRLNASVVDMSAQVQASQARELEFRALLETVQRQSQDYATLVQELRDQLAQTRELHSVSHGSDVILAVAVAEAKQNAAVRKLQAELTYANAQIAEERQRCVWVEASKSQLEQRFESKLAAAEESRQSLFASLMDETNQDRLRYAEHKEEAIRAAVSQAVLEKDTMHAQVLRDTVQEWSSKLERSEELRQKAEAGLRDLQTKSDAELGGAQSTIAKCRTGLRDALARERWLVQQGTVHKLRSVRLYLLVCALSRKANDVTAVAESETHTFNRAIKALQTQVKSVTDRLGVANDRLGLLERLRADLLNDMVNFRRATAIEHKSRLASVSHALADAEASHAALEKSLIERTTAATAAEDKVKALEVELHALSQQAAMKDGQVDAALARKKRRVNGEYEVALERISAIREEVNMISKRLSVITEQRAGLSHEVNAANSAFLDLLLDQQRSLLAQLQAVPPS